MAAISASFKHLIRRTSHLFRTNVDTVAKMYTQKRFFINGFKFKHASIDLVSRFVHKNYPRIFQGFVLLNFMTTSYAITDDEMKRNLQYFHSKLEKTASKKTGYVIGRSDSSNDMDAFGLGWEKILDSTEIRLWRRKVTAETFEYRVCGRYSDISAKAFMYAQLDIEYRKKWDNMVILLAIKTVDDPTQTEVLHWVSYYPYPLTNREYLYLRRYWIDETNGRALIVSRAIEQHPSVDKDDDSSSARTSGSSGIVRVTEYTSNMFVQSHDQYDKPGMDYFLVYYDNPKANIPRTMMKWASSSGIPSFIKKLHDAALKHQKS